MVSNEIYFSGQGTVFVATRDADGSATAFRNVGNVPSLKVTLAVNTLEHKESRTGQRLTDLRLTRDRTATVTMVLESFTKANLIMLLYGSNPDSVVGGTVSAETFPTGLAEGDMVALANPLIDPDVAVVLHDSAGTPTTVSTTDYMVDKGAGMVTILNAGSYTQPFKAAYTYLGEDIVPFFRATSTERFLRFSGLNTANADAPVIVELYRVIFDPVSDLDLINDAINQFSITGSVLYDATRDTSDVLGGFGRIVQPSA